jgi:broad specificity phosphatase PhoE
METTMQKITLVRHGQASYGTDNYDQLSPLGHEQAQILGRYFHQIGTQFDAVYTGNMVRHHETAQQILANMPNQTKAFTQLAHFNEFDFEAVITSYLSYANTSMPSSSAPRAEFYRLLKNAMIAWSREQLLGLPETWQEFQQRVVDGITQITQQSSDAKHILIATSGGAIAMLKGYTLELSVDKLIDTNLQIRNASYHQYLVSSSQLFETSFNQIPHLELEGNTSLFTYS